jgi:hypothetical protein
LENIGESNRWSLIVKTQQNRVLIAISNQSGS